MEKLPKICILSTRSDFCSIVYNSIREYAHVEKVVLERPVSKFSIISRRIKKIGVLSMLGQLLFLVLVPPILKFRSKKRISEILKRYSLDNSAIPEERITEVSSVNSEQVRNELSGQKFDLIVVVGTRIISKETLDSTSTTFVNMHAGITPRYRGVHGGYWALFNNDVENFGVTLHYVDQGIDTGSIISQQRIKVTNADNYATYPFLQSGAGLHLLRGFILGEIAGKKLNNPAQLDSKLWYHPNIWQYLSRYLSKGVK